MMSYARPKLIKALTAASMNKEVRCRTTHRPRGTTGSDDQGVCGISPDGGRTRGSGHCAAAAAGRYELLECARAVSGHEDAARQEVFTATLTSRMSELEAGVADRDDPAARAENREGWLLWLSRVLIGENAPGSDVGL